MKFIIDIIYNDNRWNKNNINQNIILKTLKTIFLMHKNLIHNIEYNICINLTNDFEIKQLNNQFRNKDKATDVLSFPDTDIPIDKSIKGFIPDTNFISLGDIAFSYDTISQYTIRYKKDFFYRFIYLLVHSILHLLNYKHDSDENYAIMNQLEKDVLRKLGLNYNHCI